MTTTTTRTGTSATAVFARGSSKAAFAQLTGGTASRSGTTATMTKNTHGLSNGDIVWHRGSNLEEYNGIFTVANVAANTYDFTIAQDPGANVTGTPMTIDKVDVSSALDNRTGFGALLVFLMQNGGTGPTVAPTVLIGYSDTTNEYDYIWVPLAQGHTIASIEAQATAEISSHARYWKVAFGGNTGQAVDYSASAYLTASLATA